MNGVIVLGSLNRDLVLRLPRLPGPGETLSAVASVEQPGGKGANQAGAAARAGAAVRMIGAVGDDAAARVVLEPLSDEGVDVTAVRAVAGTATGLAVVTVADDGENSIVVVPGANHDVGDTEVAAARLHAGEVLLCQLETPLEPVRRACADAVRAGATVVLNAAPADPAAVDVLTDVHVLVVNEHEARILADLDEPYAAGARLAARHRLVCVVTLGADGAVAHRPDGEPVVVRAPNVDALDTTGAGDAFTGYLAAGLVGRDPADLVAGPDGVPTSALREALGDAVVAGALAVTRHGALDAVPRRTELATLPHRPGPDQPDTPRKDH